MAARERVFLYNRATRGSGSFAFLRGDRRAACGDRKGVPVLRTMVKGSQSHIDFMTSPQKYLLL